MYLQWRTKHGRTASTAPAVVGVLGVFLVLLVVFLICSQRVSMPGTAIELPRFSNEEMTPVVKDVVTVTKEGRIFYNAKRMEIDDFPKVMQKLAEKYKDDRKDRVVVFYADQNTPLKIMAELFDVARGADFDAYMATSGAGLKTGTNHVSHPDDNSL